MPIEVSCSGCDHTYNVKDDAAGRRFKCKECGAVIDVPGVPLSAEESPSESFEPNIEDEFDLGSAPPAQRRRRRHADEEPESRSPLGKLSLIFGCIVWALAALSFVVLMIMGFSVAQMMEENGGGPPDQEQAMTAGFMVMGACGLGCLGLVLSIAGTILGGIALTQPTNSKGQAIGGLILNGLYLLIAVGFFLLSIIANAAN